MYAFNQTVERIENAQIELSGTIVTLDKLPVKADRARIDWQQIDEKNWMYKFFYQYEGEVVFIVAVNNYAAKPKTEKGEKYTSYPIQHPGVTHAKYGVLKDFDLNFSFVFRVNNQNVHARYLIGEKESESQTDVMEHLLTSFVNAF